MMYQILDRIIYFDNKPVTVDVRINFNTTLDFPAVTICNQNAFSCKWRGERCGQENFTQVATDHGMCYTFDSKGLIVDSAGAEDGLSLTLNVEQYEYMPGPHDAAGVKILVHHKNEFPKVHALGQAMSAGVENLPYPHGECDSPRLTYFSQYWTANSVLRERMVAECYCPVPCSFLVFDPLASYAVASPLVVERFLADVNKSALAAKFDLAREASTHRHEPEKRKLFKEQLDDLEASSPLAAAFAQRPVSETDEQKKGLLDVETEIVGLWNETSYLFKYQKSSSKRTSFGLQRHE
nr:hypothetical protein BaRGS_031228 [Batillaria attramentaria]